MTRDIVDRLRKIAKEQEDWATDEWDDSEELFKAANEIERLRAALKPFADHAETWVRCGYGPEDCLVEDSWPGGPEMKDGEPECFDVHFITVGHLIDAQKLFKPDP
jgi:hypothetical protein